MIEIGDKTIYLLNQLREAHGMEMHDVILYCSSIDRQEVCFDSVDCYSNERQIKHWFLVAYDRPGIWFGYRNETWR